MVVCFAAHVICAMSIAHQSGTADSVRQSRSLAHNEAVFVASMLACGVLDDVEMMAA